MDACATTAPEGGVMGGGVLCALDHRKEMEASSRGCSPRLDRWEGLPRHDTDITAQTQAPAAGWDGNTDKNTNTPEQVGFLSQQKRGDRAEATVFFSHKISQRGTDQDVTQEVVFFFFLFMEI